MGQIWKNWNIPAEIRDILEASPQVKIPLSREEIFKLASSDGEGLFKVAYDIPGQGRVVEATVAKCRNGLVVNYTEKYMRRRDPDCMVIGDDEETDKPKFKELFQISFDDIRTQTFEWLKNQDLIVLPFKAGGKEIGYPALLISPANAGFFVGGLADLQGMIELKDLPEAFTPQAVIYLAPPFRHTHFKGRQVVVHNRLDNLHEIFSYNLYPGPSAKKGVYGMLLQIGEKQGWLTLHASTVQVITPYENVITFLHEGASGGGKSEMLEYPHREPDGRLLFGTNSKNGDKFYVSLTQGCSLKPVTDDMAISHPKFIGEEKKLVVADAEAAWFIRLNHITHYNTDPQLENMCIHVQEPMIFLNIQGIPNSTCLIWEHTEDAPGKPCPNPRVILPRRFVPNIIEGRAEVDYRSFGIRAPQCTFEYPSYGILGVLHILPPALAWLWRLVSPRGDSNPSVTESSNLSSEGVGSYWPFATGKYINHANLLLRQIVETSKTRYLLFPNQYIGVWNVGFMPQWISREYMARRGVAKFKADQLITARCPLLGYVPATMQIEGGRVPEWFIEVNKQPEVGDQGYEEGANLLYHFFRTELSKYLTSDIDDLGKNIIECCLYKGTLEDYLKLIPMTW